MAGLYIHIPFCEKACPYCDFYFLVAKQRLPDFLEALLLELRLRQSAFSESLDTIYFGGGTPSVLSIDQIAAILNEIKRHYKLSTALEISFEINPEHVSESLLAKYRALGINRLSFGIQSFRNDELKLLGRQHSAQKAKASFHAARSAGFDNISIDLIFGIPGQTIAHWKENLAQAIDLRPEHLSIYSLTVEDGTPLAYAIKTGKMEAPSSDLQAAFFMEAYASLEKNGYEAYEISNYSLPGYRSKHNSAYWSGTAYAGFGPSAHSYLNHERYFNPADMRQYLDSLQNGRLALKQEKRSKSNILNEHILVALRTKEGISLEDFQQDFGKKARTTLRNQAEKHLNAENLICENERLFLSLKGRLLADRIAMELFTEDDES